MVISSVLASLVVATDFNRSLVQLFTFAILLTIAIALLPYLVGSFVIPFNPAQTWLTFSQVSHLNYQQKG